MGATKCARRHGSVDRRSPRPHQVRDYRNADGDFVVELHVIVANAGIAAPQVWNEITPESFCDVMEVNVTGAWNTVMAGDQHIIDGDRGGSIVLISSAAGVKLQPFMIHYTTGKHAVTGMVRAFAAELGKHSIRVNSVHPGAVNSDMGSGDIISAISRTIETNPQLAHMMTPLLPTWFRNPMSIDQGATQY